MPASHGARQVRKDAKITAKVVPDAELKALFDECDADGGATICLAEFSALLSGDPVCQLLLNCAENVFVDAPT